MSRLALAPLVLLCCLLTAFSANAAPLVLQDKEVGYSISFPEGWQTMPADTLSAATAMAAGGLGITDAQAGKSNGAAYIDQKSGVFKMYMIVSFSLDKVHTDNKEQLRAAARGDTAALNAIKRDLEEAAAEVGATVYDSKTTENSYCLIGSHKEPDLPAGQTLFQKMCVRFLKDKDSVLVYLGVYPGAESTKFDTDFQSLIDSIQFTQ